MIKNKSKYLKVLKQMIGYCKKKNIYFFNFLTCILAYLSTHYFLSFSLVSFLFFSFLFFSFLFFSFLFFYISSLIGDSGPVLKLFNTILDILYPFTNVFSNLSRTSSCTWHLNILASKLNIVDWRNNSSSTSTKRLN